MKTSRKALAKLQTKLIDSAVLVLISHLVSVKCNQNCFNVGGICRCKACSDLIQTHNFTYAWDLSIWKVSGFKVSLMSTSLCTWCYQSECGKLFAAMHGHLHISVLKPGTSSLHAAYFFTQCLTLTHFSSPPWSLILCIFSWSVARSYLRSSSSFLFFPSPSFVLCEFRLEKCPDVQWIKVVTRFRPIVFLWVCARSCFLFMLLFPFSTLTIVCLWICIQQWCAVGH